MVKVFRQENQKIILQLRDVGKLERRESVRVGRDACVRSGLFT